MRRTIAILVFAACTGCAAEVASRPHAESTEPVVGRLKTRSGTIDLTVGSFAPDRDGIPREAMASEVMADIDLDDTFGAELDPRRRNATRADTRPFGATNSR